MMILRATRTTWTACALTLWMCAPPVRTFAAASASDATVFIRVTGEIRIKPSDSASLSGDTLELREVEIRSGSGFVISPLGFVVTNHHVINDFEYEVTSRAGRKFQVTIDVQRIEVVFPSRANSLEPQRRFTASVRAADADLDLAVLYIGGQDLPYAPLGDSDAVQRGQPMMALGFPLGRLVEVGKATSEVGKATNEDLAPEATVSSGTVSSLRTDNANDLRYIQTDASINPGNSGGPLVDREGYVQGVIQLRLREAHSIGFAIPVNLLKKFLTTNGLDQVLPTRFLFLGLVHAPDGKGLRIRLPSGFDDSSSSRLQLASGGASDGIVVRIDRIPSPWSLEQLEQALLREDVFERFSGTPISKEVVTSLNGRRARRGSASGFVPDSDGQLKMEYALVELPRERIVARYVGPAEQMAANQSVLRASLASLEAEPLLTVEVERPQTAVWARVQPTLPNAPEFSIPAGWIVAPGGPSTCTLRIPAEMSLSASPSGDYTVSFRFAWWRADTVTPNDGAATCAGSRAETGGSTYAVRGDWLGLGYVIEGRFLSTNGRGVAQVEVLAPTDKIGLVRDLFTAWVKTLSRP